MASNWRNCGTHYTALTLALSTAVCAFPAFKFKTDRRFFLCRRRLRCGGGNRGNYRPNPCCANLFSLPRFPCWANGIGSIEGPLTLEDPIKEHSILDSVNRSGAVSECNLKRKRDLSRHSSRPRPVFRLRRPPVCHAPSSWNDGKLQITADQLRDPRTKNGTDDGNERTSSSPSDIRVRIRCR